MKSFRLFLALGILLISSSISWADIPNLINFQGILDSAGNPKANDTVSVEFRIYDALVGGNVKWIETQSVTTSTGGVFTVLLGSSVPIPDSVFNDTTRWLGIKVGVNPEISPRQQIVSNAYAYRVGTVDGAAGGTIFGNTFIQSDLYVNGNVGIGTTNPQQTLQLASDVGGVLRLERTNLTFPSRWDIVPSQNTAGDLTFVDRINSIERVTLSSTGNVGIGTTTPNAGLVVSGSDIWKSAIGIENTTAGMEWRLATTSNQNFNIVKVSGATFTPLSISATTGNVGIGTTNPGSALEVRGVGDEQLRIGRQGWPPYLSLYSGTADAVIHTVNAVVGLHFVMNNTDRMFLANSGNVGIGTTSPPNILTVVQNSATDPVADAWTTYSSAEYKQGIHELSDQEYSEALHKLLNTPVVKYRYKGQSFMDKEKIGIVIEEAPEEIISEGNAKAASLSEYISLLHAGLKAQQTEIESLKQMLKQLQDEQSEK